MGLSQITEMTPEQIKSEYPNASKSFIARNSIIYAGGDCLSVTRPTAATPPPPVLDVARAMSRPSEKLNKTEAGFLMLLKARNYPWLGVQNITLKLADDCRYTPDFSAVGPNGEMLFFEVKGFMRDDAQVKLKVAARQFKWAVFFLVFKTKGGFSEQEVKP